MISSARNRVGLLIAVLTTLAAALPAWAGPSPSWTRVYSRGAGVAEAAVVSPDGTVVVVAGTRGVDSHADIVLVAYDAASGARRWSRSYDGQVGNFDEAADLAIDPLGRWVFVTGQSWGGRNLGVVTIAYDLLSGGRRWVNRRVGQPVAVAASPDGAHVYVTASVEGSGGVYDSDYLTLAYRAGTGTVAWVHRYDGPVDIDWPTDIAVSGDGKLVVVTGASQGSHGYRTATVAIEAASGAQAWVRRSAGMLGGSIVAAPSGSRTYLTTEAQGDFLTIALTGWGGERWRTRYDGPGTGFAGDAPAAIAVAPDGSAVFVTGSSWSDGHGYDYATVAYGTSDGVQRWAKRYTHPAFDNDEPADVGVSRDGRLVVVTGASRGVGGDADIATVAYDVATGSTVWVDRFDGSGGGDDVGASIAAGLGAALVVAGSTTGIDTGSDIVTIAWAAGP
jgi:hypothetical protein